MFKTCSLRSSLAFCYKEAEEDYDEENDSTYEESQGEGGEEESLQDDQVLEENQDWDNWHGYGGYWGPGGWVCTTGPTKEEKVEVEKNEKFLVEKKENKGEVDKAEKKGKVEKTEEKAEVEQKEEKKASPTRRHSTKRPASPCLALTYVPPFEKKDIPVKWGPIKNASAALSIFKQSQGYDETNAQQEKDEDMNVEDKKDEGAPRVSWWDNDYVNKIPEMTVAEQIRVVQEFTTMSRLLSWKPPQLPETTWTALTDIANLVFNYGVIDSATIVRHLKQSTVPDVPPATLKGLKALRDMNMEQCTALVYWLNGKDDRKSFESYGQTSSFYRTMLNDALWPEVLAVRSLIWDYLMESPQIIFKYIHGENWEVFVTWFQPDPVDVAQDCNCVCMSYRFLKVHVLKRTCSQPASQKV